MCSTEGNDLAKCDVTTLMDVGHTEKKSESKEKRRKKQRQKDSSIVSVDHHLFVFAIHPTHHVLYINSLLSFTRYKDDACIYPSF